MGIDDSKVNYSSTWDIDQLVIEDDLTTAGFSNRVAVTSGTTLLVQILTGTGLPDIPTFEVQFQVTTLSRWYQEGAFSTDGTLANMHSFSSYLQDGGIYITTDIAGIAKYFIWADKVDY